MNRPMRDPGFRFERFFFYFLVFVNFLLFFRAWRGVFAGLSGSRADSVGAE